MKISRLLTIIAFLAILAMATHMALDEDTWWHLRAGQWMVEQGKIITTDPFSYTRGGESWQYPGLWVQVGMFLLFDWLGPGGLNLWVSLMVLAIFYFVWKSMQSGNLLIQVLILLLSAAASAVYWAARPYLLTYLLAAVFFFLLERWSRKENRTLWVLPILMVVWVNSHGGYLAGFLLLAPYLVETFLQWLAARRWGEAAQMHGARLVHLVQVGLLSLAATLVNPAGLERWMLPFTTVKRQAEQLFIAEWQSPDFHEPYLLPFLALVGLALLSVGISRKRLTLSQGLLLAGFGVLGLYSVRNIFFFVIVAPAVLSQSLAAYLEHWREKLNIQRKLDFDQTPTPAQNLLHWILLAAFALAAFSRVIAFLPAETSWEMISEQAPTAAVAYIQEEQPDGRLFNSYNFGGYCIWALPEYPVFVDGRADLHGDEIILEWYRTVKLAGDWEAVLERWDIGVVLVEPYQPLAAELKELGWRVGYQDDLAMVLLKD